MAFSNNIIPKFNEELRSNSDKYKNLSMCVQIFLVEQKLLDHNKKIKKISDYRMTNQPKAYHEE